MVITWTAIPMLDRLINHVMSGATGTAFASKAANAQKAFQPSIDVRANEAELLFVCDVPGLRHEDLDVTVQDNVLTIHGQRSYDGDAADKVWLSRIHGSFTHAFTLPDSVDAGRLAAELADGVLTVRVPKMPKAKPGRIEIGGSGTLAKELAQK